MGGDVGVFPHGDNAREMEMMVDYGMSPMDVLRAATSENADVFRINKTVGRIQPGLLADILIVSGNPSVNIHDIRNTKTGNEKRHYLPAKMNLCSMKKLIIDLAVLILITRPAIEQITTAGACF